VSQVYVETLRIVTNVVAFAGFKKINVTAAPEEPFVISRRTREALRVRMVVQKVLPGSLDEPSATGEAEQFFNYEYVVPQSYFAKRSR
jgi:hypothetical protein